MSANQGQDVTLDVMGKSVQGYMAGLDNRGGPGVLVMHAWWGLTPFFKRLCDRFAAEGFVAFSANLYGDKTASTVEQAQALMEQLDDETARAVALAALDRLRSYAPQGGLGIVGFSMGAAWALLLATLRPEEFRAVTLFYGAYMVDFSLCKAAILGHFAETDEYEPLDGVREMEAAMRSAGLSCDIHIYPGTGHWFFEDNRPDAFNKEAAALAWGRTAAFLKERLRR